MTEARLALGCRGEEAAVRHLRRRGLKILARNYRTPVGEVDIIASNRRNLVFVEVKTRRTATFGSPQEAVGPRKQRQIIRAAQWYLGQFPAGRLQPRFDVIAVVEEDGEFRIEQFEDAFGV